MNGGHIAFPRHISPVADTAALRAALEAFVADAGTRTAAAELLGISGTYLNDVMAERRDIAALASRLGYTSLTLFVPMTGPAVASNLAAQVIEGLRAHMGKGGAA
jgi:hypothetical protein